MPSPGSFSNVAPELILSAIILSALIGGIAGVVVAWLSGRQSYKNELLRLAIQTAHEDFLTSQKISEIKGENMYPMSAYIAFHHIFLHLLQKGVRPKDALQETFKEVSELLPEYRNAPFSDYLTKWKSE